MYEEIRKPKMLQDVPLSLIRPLPILYYSNKFVTGRVPDKVQDLYQSNLIFLGDALNKISYIINNNDFRDLSLSIRSIKQTLSATHIKEIQSIGIELARICTQAKSELQKHRLEIKTTAMDLYAIEVDPLKVLLVSMDKDSGTVQKVMGVLKSFCHYNVDCSSYDNADFSQKLVNAEYIIFSSTSSPEIHQQVKKLKTYLIPGLALVPVGKQDHNLEKAIRHGSQLLRTGFPVLFRMFTPIRLFTTIEKTYLAHHLS